MEHVYLGKLEEESSKQMFGIISFDGSEIYKESGSYRREDNLCFQIKSIGPKGRLKRAINVVSYNAALEGIYLNRKKEYDFEVERYNYYVNCVKLFKEKGIISKLSSVGKKGLNLYNRIPE
tara:strand:- start:9393 stop:9755 length:363 start_codon:yes stop_codon:yes gene_type:complete